mgnify:CR=1 FL=1
MDSQSYREEFLLQFGSSESEIDSRTLGESLMMLSTALEEINTELRTGKSINIRIKPFKPGSFQVPFELVEIAVIGLIPSPNLSYITQLINILKEFIEIKIQLKGSTPSSVETEGSRTVIKTESGDIYNIEKITGNLIFKNIKINESFNKGMGRLDSDGSINDISIMQSSNKPLISVSKQDFQNFTSGRTTILDKENYKIIKAFLYIHKVVFDKTSKWGFIYEGNKISAIITDQEFHKSVEKEDRFGNGDVLEVLLKVHQVFDEIAGTYINKFYEIIQVIEHIPRAKQMELFEN